MQTSREIQYERQLLAKIGLSRPKVFPKECAWYRRDGTVPPDMNHHVFTLRVQGKSYREIAKETGMSKSAVGRMLGAFKQTK